MENMRKIVIHCETNTVGTDSWNFVLVPKDTSDGELDDLAHEYSLNNAEVYGIYPPSDSWGLDEDEDEDEEPGDDNIGGYWCDYDPKLHDGHTMSGSPVWVE